MGLVAAKRLVAAELDIARIDIGHTGPIEKSIICRGEPLLAWLVGMDGEVVAVPFIGPVVRARRGQEEGSKEADPGGELIVDADSSLRRGATPSRPSAEGERHAKVAPLVSSNNRKAEAESVVKDMGLGEQGKGRKIENGGVDVSLRVRGIGRHIPIEGEHAGAAVVRLVDAEPFRDVGEGGHPGLRVAHHHDLHTRGRPHEQSQRFTPGHRPGGGRRVAA